MIAFFKDEVGSAAVLSAMPDAAMSSVNLVEVVTRLIDDGFALDDIRTAIAGTSVDTIGFDDELAFDAGALRERTRAHGLSLGDRACLALAQRLGVPALTADRQWAHLDIGVEVRLIRD
jgi:ribonuclease VapC